MTVKNVLRVMTIGLAFAGYNLYSAIDRRLGEGTLRQMLFGRPEADHK